MIEIGVALLLTIAALLAVGLTLWAAEAMRLRVSDAWARPTIGESRTTAAYMTIANESDSDDVLKSAQAPKAKSVELHQTTMSPDGKMQMREIKDGLSIAAGGTVRLEPGGTHFMILDLDNALAVGDELALTLEFAKAGLVEVMVPVSAGGPQGTAPGADHSHH